MKSRAREFIIKDSNPIKQKEIKKLFFNLSTSFAPYKIEKTVLLPMQKPNIMEFSKTITENELPTAARAFGPINLPTIIVSVTLYSCWNRFPAIIGSANFNIALVSFPTVKS